VCPHSAVTSRERSEPATSAANRAGVLEGRRAPRGGFRWGRVGGASETEPREEDSGGVGGRDRTSPATPQDVSSFTQPSAAPASPAPPAPAPASVPPAPPSPPWPFAAATHCHTPSRAAHAYPSTQPMSSHVQSPTWHVPFLPHVSLNEQSLGFVHFLTKLLRHASSSQTKPGAQSESSAQGLVSS